jgi:hypothetical protein
VSGFRPDDRVMNRNSRELGTVVYANKREVMVRRDYGALVPERPENVVAVELVRAEQKGQE